MRKLLLKTVTALTTALLLLSPVVARADDADDVVMLTNGGRLRGVVIEEDPQKGVRIKLLDGSVRSLAPDEVREVLYHGQPNPLPVAPDLTPNPTTGTAVFPPPETPIRIVPVPPPPTPAESAESPEPTPEKGVRKFEIGARLGVALPMGNFVADGNGASSTSLGDVFAVKIPILIEAGYDVTPHVMLGFHIQYGIIVDKTGDTACPSGFSCSDHDVEIGIEGQYHFAPSRPLDAWLGLGLGYELERETVTIAGQSQDYSLDGPQFLKLQGGADLRVGRVMTAGPFISFSLAEYTKDTGNDIAAPALHEWLSFGVKGTFKVGG